MNNLLLERDQREYVLKIIVDVMLFPVCVAHRALYDYARRCGWLIVSHCRCHIFNDIFQCAHYCTYVSIKRVFILSRLLWFVLYDWTLDLSRNRRSYGSTYVANLYRNFVIIRSSRVRVLLPYVLQCQTMRCTWDTDLILLGIRFLKLDRTVHISFFSFFDKGSKIATIFSSE